MPPGPEKDLDLQKTGRLQKRTEESSGFGRGGKSHFREINELKPKQTGREIKYLDDRKRPRKRSIEEVKIPSGPSGKDGWRGDNY